MKRPIIIAFVVLAACAHAPAYTADQLESIMRPLAYEQEIDRKCEDKSSVSDADKFLETLSGDAKTEAAGILASIATEVEQGEAEYVCTVELYYSTQDRANNARALWNSLKGRP